MPAAFASRSDKARIEVRSERHRSAFDTGMHSFIDEARLLARFKHPALVEVLRFWEDNGTAYMAMPRYSGQTLRQILRDNGGQCDEQWLRGIVAPMLDVLEMLHAHDIFHRDVAPDNIIIQNDGTPVLLDLGSARRVLGDANQAPTVIVKPGYAPIEQYAEDLSTPQGPWTDIYALGAVLHLAVTGMAPSASVSRLMKDNLEPLSGRDFPASPRHFSAPSTTAWHCSRATARRPSPNCANCWASTGPCRRARCPLRRRHHAPGRPSRRTTRRPSSSPASRWPT